MLNVEKHKEARELLMSLVWQDMCIKESPCYVEGSSASRIRDSLPVSRAY